MNRRQALEDLFLAVRNDLLNKGVSKKTAFKVAEAIKRAFELSSEHAVLICDNIYESDKDFKGIILHVKGE